jgi:hypothetical protein
VAVCRVASENGGSGVCLISFATSCRIPTSETGSQIAAKESSSFTLTMWFKLHVVPVRIISIAPR